MKVGIFSVSNRCLATGSVGIPASGSCVTGMVLGDILSDPNLEQA